MLRGGDSWHLFRRSRQLVSRIAGVALLLSVSQPQMAQPHERHRLHTAPTEETATESARRQMLIPDVVLINQDGQQVHFYNALVKDNVVAISFIFTTCTTSCTPIGANFSVLQQLMGDYLGRNLFLISISVDPVNDTPERLKAWGHKFNAGRNWTLLTGPKHEVDKLLKALKVFTPDIRDHSPIVLIGNDTTDEWTRMYGLAPPAKLAEGITSVMTFAAKDASPLDQNQR